MMGLYTNALAIGAGYALGRPGGRAQIQKYLRKASELASGPRTKRLRERGWDIAGDQVTALRRRLAARTRATEQRSEESGAPVTADADTTPGFGGISVVDDSRAALGFATLPPESPGPTTT